MEENLVLNIKSLKACIYFDLAISLAGNNLKESKSHQKDLCMRLINSTLLIILEKFLIKKVTGNNLIKQ